MSHDVLRLAAADAQRSTEPLGDRPALEQSLRDAWSDGLATGHIRPIHRGATATDSGAVAQGEGAAAPVRPPAAGDDDRVVLPLEQTRDAAAALCGWWCGRRRPDGHVDPCLVPLLEQREQLLRAAAPTGQVSGDCLDPVKHSACSGCACSCHRHSQRTAVAP